MESQRRYKEISDEALAASVAHDVEAFGELMRRYQQPLERYVMRTTRTTREGVEDILQDSFLKAYQNINSFDPTLTFSSWMYRIVYNTVVSKWRKENARPEGHLHYIDDDFIERFAADDDVVEEIDRGLLEGKMQGVLESLDPKYRDVLVLRYMEDKDYKEIADILKKPMGTVATLLSRAKKALRLELEQIT